MDRDQLTILMQKYLDDTATPEEVRALHDWYRDSASTEVVWPADHPGERAQIEAGMLVRLQEDIRDSARIVPIHRNRYYWIAAGVTGLLLLTGLVYRWNGKRPEPAPVAQTQAMDVLPGGNKAQLVLGDGKVVTLDSAGSGVVAEQGSEAVEKTAHGQLAYVAAADGAAAKGAGSTTDNASSEIVYNTIITPQGGTFSVKLSDGTRVWLNAGSSLKYPTVFSGSQRKVELKGEAYFEVAPDADRPFHVVSGEQTIDVLGTHFNVNAYDNEPEVRTTLLQGSVRVVKNGKDVLLRPGQQSVSDLSEGLTIRKDIDTAEVMAWKNGMFQFDAADIGTVMRQIARWYDVDVVIQGKLPDDHFRGKIPRNVNASQVLQILALSGINFKIEGKKITLLTPAM